MNFLIDIFMHTGLFVITIPLFYFYFVITTVNSAVADNLIAIAQQRIQETKLNTVLKKTDVQKLFDSLNQKVIPELSEFNSMFESSNSRIFYTAFAVAGSISAACLITGITLCFLYNVNIINTLISNSIVLTFILLSEFIIVTFFLNKFVTKQYTLFRNELIL
jgi:hypothetical protein